MKPGYEIKQYGLSKIDTIWVYNYWPTNKISMVGWDNTEHLITNYLVAIFKIKYK